MRNRRALGVLFLCGLYACGGASRSGVPTITADFSRDQNSRFLELEANAVELTPQLVASLPDVANEDVLFFVESLGQAPTLDAERNGILLSPPESWTLGTTEEDEEVRLELLEPEGGAMVIPAETALDAEEVMVTYIVRYSRRNVLLTDEGTAVAVHVVPVAARLDTVDQGSLFWISTEAGNP